MNTEILKTEFPKCYKKLLEYYDLDENLLNAKYKYFLEDYLGRNLYDFFDDNGVYVSTMWSWNYTGEKRLLKYVIELEWYETVVYSGEYSDVKRPKVEDVAFDIAFEILESRL